MRFLEEVPKSGNRWHNLECVILSGVYQPGELLLVHQAAESVPLFYKIVVFLIYVSNRLI